MSEAVKMDRRDFVRGAAGVAFAGAAYAATTHEGGHEHEQTVWQLDPNKCTQCGRCQAHQQRQQAQQHRHGFGLL